VGATTAAVVVYDVPPESEPTGRLGQVG